MSEPDARLIILTTPALEAGFRLAGVDIRVVTSPEEAEESIHALLAQGQRGVISVHRPFFESIDPGFRLRLESSVSPVVVPLPDGLEDEGPSARRARIASLLQRAVGYHIVFEGDDQ
jgi:vacuolar-type H+-ATPase subunit F/Vma7